MRLLTTVQLSICDVFFVVYYIKKNWDMIADYIQPNLHVGM